MRKLNKKFILNMEKEVNIGKMGLNIKEIGEMGWQMAKVYFIMLMVMCILVNFNRIKLMDLGSMYMKMGKNIKDTGRIISRKG